MKITATSGKGGTGKTTTAASLVTINPEKPPLFLDRDVEAPDAHLFLNPAFAQRQDVAVPIP